MTLPELCEAIQDQVEALETDTEDYAGRLKRLKLKLARDAAEHVGESYAMGEIPALCQRICELMAALAAAAEGPDDRQRRYGRQQALLNLLTLCESIRVFDVGTHAQRRASIASLRGLVSDALAGLVELVEDD